MNREEILEKSRKENRNKDLAELAAIPIMAAGLDAIIYGQIRYDKSIF